MPMANQIDDDLIIELDVPISDIGGYVTSLFHGSDFITELQDLKVQSFEYDEETETFHFVLLVETRETIN